MVDWRSSFDPARSSAAITAFYRRRRFFGHSDRPAAIDNVDRNRLQAFRNVAGAREYLMLYCRSRQHLQPLLRLDRKNRIKGNIDGCQLLVGASQQPFRGAIYIAKLFQDVLASLFTLGNVVCLVEAEG